MEAKPLEPSFPEVSAETIGWLDRDQMIEVDRIMVEDLRIELIQMMENAGRNLADFVIRRFNPGSVAVLAGPGGNGGGGLVAARHLANLGVDVSVTLSRSIDRMSGVPAHQVDILTRMGVPFEDEPRRAELTIDAVIGYSLRGAPRGRARELISAMEFLESPIVSLDNPSGLNVSHGTAPGAVVFADATLTLALPKVGLRSTSRVGELYLADISVPPSVYASLDAEGQPVVAPPFDRGAVLRCVDR